MSLIENVPFDISKRYDFSDILQNIMQNKMKGQEMAEASKYHNEELQIKRQEAQRKAAKDQMLQDLINGNYNGMNNNTSNNNENNISNNVPNNMQNNYQQTDRNNTEELFRRINSPNPSTQQDKLRDRNNFIEMMNRKNNNAGNSNIPNNMQQQPQMQQQELPQQEQQKNQNKPNIKGMDANKAMLLSGIFKLPTQVVDGKLATSFGTFQLGESAGEKGKREVKEQFMKNLGSSDVKTVEDWNKTITTNHELMPVLENIQYISSNPNFQSMYKNPEYLGYDLSYLKRFGNKEQQDLLTSLGTNAKSIFSSTGQDFKGSFREFEYKLLNKVAPDETKDTIQQIISKTNTTLALRNLITKRLTMADNIVRSSNGQISPSNALDIADKQINSRKEVKEIEDKFNQSQEEQRKEIEKRKNTKSENPITGQQNDISSPVNDNTVGHPEVEIYDPQGTLVARGSKEAAEKFLKKHRGHYQKVIKNG